MQFSSSASLTFCQPTIKKLRINFLNLTFPPKAEKLHFEVFNNIHPSGDLLRQRFNFDLNSCIFCDEETNLFFVLLFSNTFWCDMYGSFSPRFYHKLYYFGIIMKDKNTELLLNILFISFISGNFFIHKCKCIKTQPLLVIFMRTCTVQQITKVYEKENSRKTTDHHWGLNIWREPLAILICFYIIYNIYDAMYIHTYIYSLSHYNSLVYERLCLLKSCTLWLLNLHSFIQTVCAFRRSRKRLRSPKKPYELVLSYMAFLWPTMRTCAP